MSSPSKTAATSIWDDRYREGKLACAQENVASDPIDYTQHPFLHQHAIAKRLTGAPGDNPLDLVTERFFSPPAKKMLALGSGMAFVEQWFAESGHVENILAFEQSSVAVAAARKRIAEVGLESRIEIRAEDVMSAGLEPGQFDVVMVHASMILPLTYRYFDVEYRGDFGGAFMRPFFVGILPNFDFTDAKDQTVARLIVLVEELLTRYGVIPNYHTKVVARRREEPRTDVAPEDLRRINYADWPGL